MSSQTLEKLIAQLQSQLSVVPNNGNLIAWAQQQHQLQQMIAQLQNQLASSNNLNGVVNGSQNPTQTTAAQNALNSLGDFKGSDALQQLITQFSNINGNVSADYQNQIYENLLDLIMKNEQRSYDQQVQQEQRVYDNPLSQLSRLTGAGIGRDAAIQLLQGGQASALIGSGSDVGASGTPLTPSERQAQSAQVATNILGAVTGLISLGFTAPQAIAQASLISSQTAMTAKQVKAFEAAGSVGKMLKDIGAGAEAFGSVAGAAAAIQSAADNGNQEARDFIASGGIDEMYQSAPYLSPALSQTYRSEKDPEYFNSFVRQQFAQERLTGVQAEKVGQEIINLKQELSNIVAQEEFIKKNTALLEHQANKLDSEAASLKEQAELYKQQGKTEAYKRANLAADSKLKKAQALREGELTHQLQNENLITDQVLGSRIDGQTGLSWITQKQLDDMIIGARTLSGLKDKKAWEAYADNMLQDAKTATAVNMLLEWRKTASLEYCQQNPVLTQLSGAIEDCGIGAYIEASAKQTKPFMPQAPGWMDVRHPGLLIGYPPASKFK